MRDAEFASVSAESAGSRNTALASATLWDDLSGGSFTVVGLGKSGVAAANALVARGADVLVVDDKSSAVLGSFLRQLDPRITVAVDRAQTGAPVGRRGDLFIMSPGVPPHSQTFRDCEALATLLVSEIELFWRLDRAANGGLGHPVAAISGTDGKTTTTLWTAHLLQTAGHTVCVGGNIGEPLCGFLGQLAPQTIVVAEVSAFQLLTCSQFRPRAAVVTNIALDHMDYFSGDLDRYVRTKCQVATHMGPGDSFALNGDDPELQGERDRLAQGVPHAWQVFTTQGIPERGLGFDGSWLVWALDPVNHVRIARADELGVDGRHPIVGIHNVENALAATSLALAFGVPLAAIRQGLRSFSLPGHRIEPVGQVGQVRFVDDSKATNPHAAIAGLRATKRADEQLVWLGGGSEKDADFAELADVVAEVADAAVLIGQTAPRIEAALAGRLPVTLAASMPEAVAAAFGLCNSGAAVVLLSPACASFDMFQSYAHRGEVFADAVAKLIAAVGGHKAS